MNNITILSKTLTGTEPVTLAEIKTHLLVSHASDDTYIESFLLPACREELEGKLNKCLADKTITAEIESDGALDLMYPPVVSITSMVDDEGTAITDYELRESRITTTHDWAKIVYDVEANVTASDKLKLLELIAYKYTHRGDEVKPKINTQWFL